MIKKNILPIFLLALVVLLSVFYIKQSNEDTKSAYSDNISDVSPVSSDFAAKRIEVLESRTDEVEELEKSIATGNLTQDQISEVIEKINEIYYLKYTEVELEDAITLLGYEECLVIIDGFDVDVTVSCKEIDSKAYIKIINLVKEKLSNDYKVSVEKVTSDN